MRRAFLFTLVMLMPLFGCRHDLDLARPKSQDNIGVEMARMNLWREAMFRFNRAVQLNPGDAMAHNNLAVAYEANGDFDNAAKEYREALRLDRTNPYIQKNYSRYTEFMSRSKKRQQQRRDVTPTRTATSTTGAPAKETAAPAPGTAPAGTAGAAAPAGTATPTGSAAPPSTPTPDAGTAAAPAAGSSSPAAATPPAAAPTPPATTSAPPATSNPPTPPPASTTPPVQPPTAPHPGGAR